MRRATPWVLPRARCKTRAAARARSFYSDLPLFTYRLPRFALYLLLRASIIAAFGCRNAWRMLCHIPFSFHCETSERALACTRLYLAIDDASPCLL